MVAPTGKKVAKQGKAESLPGLGATVSITGGGAYQRRFLSDYSKRSHAAEDARAKEQAALLGPNISAPSILGGVREL